MPQSSEKYMHNFPTLLRLPSLLSVDWSVFIPSWILYGYGKSSIIVSTTNNFTELNTIIVNFWWGYYAKRMV